jgi:hypothetical protein
MLAVIDGITVWATKQEIDKAWWSTRLIYRKENKKMTGQCDQGEYSNGNEVMPEPNELSDVWLIEGLGEWKDVGTNEGPNEEPDERPTEEPNELSDVWFIEGLGEWTDVWTNEDPIEEPEEWPPEEPEEWPIEEPDEWPPEEPYELPEEPEGPPNLSFFGGVDG